MGYAGINSKEQFFGFGGVGLDEHGVIDWHVGCMAYGFHYTVVGQHEGGFYIVLWVGKHIIECTVNHVVLAGFHKLLYFITELTEQHGLNTLFNIK